MEGSTSILPCYLSTKPQHPFTTSSESSNVRSFHGPAPLHRTLLAGCQRSGVTVQTLHPEHFDRGTILAQTPFPGFEHGCSTVPELVTVMSSKGAEMLVHCIKNRLYLPSAKEPRSLQGDLMSATARAAPKVTTKDKFIDWNTWTADVIIRRHLAIGPLWNLVRNAHNIRRLIWTRGFTISKDVAPSTDLPIGQLVVFGDGNGADGQIAYVRTCDNRVLRVDKIKIEGGVETLPLRAAKKADMLDQDTHHGNGSMTRILLSTDSLDGHQFRTL